MLMFPLFDLLRRIAEPTSFLPPFFLAPEKQVLGDFNCHHPFGNSKGTSDPHGEKVFVGLFSLTSFLNDPERQLFSIASLVATSLLMSHLLPPLLPSRAPGRCLRTRGLISYQFQ